MDKEMEIEAEMEKMVEKEKYLKIRAITQNLWINMLKVISLMP